MEPLIECSGEMAWRGGLAASSGTRPVAIDFTSGCAIRQSNLLLSSTKLFRRQPCIHIYIRKTMPVGTEIVVCGSRSALTTNRLRRSHDGT